MGSSTTLLNIVTLSEFTDLVEKTFSDYSKLPDENAQQLFIRDDLSAHTGNTKRYDEVDTETFANLKLEGADAAKASVGVGYNKTMTAKRVAKEIDITWEMRHYNKHVEVGNKLVNLASFCPTRLELDLTHVLTFCTSSTYTDMDGTTVTVTGGDANPIVYATHALAFSSTTWRNRVSGDPAFSQGSLESAELLMTTDVLSNYAEKRVMNFNTIITGSDPNTKRAVKQLLESTADVDGVQSGLMNVKRGAYRHVELPWLATTATGANDSTKRRWWFVAATGQGVSGWQAYLGIFEPMNLKKPSAGNNGEDVHSDTWTYGTRMSYGICALSGRGLIGSCPVS
jgi:hypothetical protein